MRIVFLGVNKIEYKYCKFIIEKSIDGIVGILIAPKFLIYYTLITQFRIIFIKFFFFKIIV